MKAKLIIINWLFAWIPLCYSGDSPLVAIIIVGYFGFASLLLNKNKKAVEKELTRFNTWIDKLITR